MIRSRYVNAEPIIQAPQVKHEVPGSGIVTRCFCGGKLDRAGIDLLYCDLCGSWYLGRQLKSAHSYHLTRVPA